MKYMDISMWYDVVKVAVSQKLILYLVVVVFGTMI